MSADIRIVNGDNGFLFRAAGIWKRDGKVLMQTDGESGWAFPGGHVQLGETAAQSLKRELSEELGVEIKVGPLLFVSEDAFEWRGVNWQSVCLYFEVDANSLPHNHIPIAGPSVERGSPVTFDWLPIAKLDEYETYPANALELLSAHQLPSRAAKLG